MSGEIRSVGRDPECREGPGVSGGSRSVCHMVINISDVRKGGVREE